MWDLMDFSQQPTLAQTASIWVKISYLTIRKADFRFETPQLSRPFQPALPALAVVGVVGGSGWLLGSWGLEGEVGSSGLLARVLGHHIYSSAFLARVLY